MLAVIALVVILLSLLSPALHSARRYARNAVCQSNLHQQGVGLIGYTINTKYYTGAHTWSHNAPKNWVIWPARIRQFTEGTSSEWFWCPEAPASSRWTVKYGSGLGAEYGFFENEVRLEWNTPFSYGYNNWGTLDFAIPQWGLGGLSEHKDWGELPKYRVKHPSRMFAVGDAQVDGIWDAFIDHNQAPELPADRHPSDKANIVFCDGHVEGMTLENILDPTPTQLGRWNNDGQPH